MHNKYVYWWSRGLFGCRSSSVHPFGSVCFGLLGVDSHRRRLASKSVSLNALQRRNERTSLVCLYISATDCLCKGQIFTQAEVCLARGAARQCPSKEDLAVDGQCPVEWHGTGWIYVVWGRVMMLQQRIKTVSDRGWSPGGNLRSCGETREISVHVCLQCSFWLWNVNDDDG